MTKVIYLFWHSKINHFNFGDDINPFIIENLSNQPVKRVMVFSRKRSIILNFVKMTYGVVLGRYEVSVFIEYIRSLIHSDYIVCIGSILQNGFSNNAKIWGSGIIHKECQVNGSKFYAVRGLKTVQRIENLGYEFKGKIGDPASLLPLIYNPNIEKKNKIGVIPHVTHFAASKIYFNDQEKYILIDLSDSNIENTIDLIKSCSHIVSSSLHGLIVSHAYNVPALHIQLDGKLAGDGIKFLDYYSSVGIPEYSPIKILDFKLLNDYSFIDMFEKYNEFALPKEGVVIRVQKDLLSVAPFKLTDKYKSYNSEK